MWSTKFFKICLSIASKTAPSVRPWLVFWVSFCSSSLCSVWTEWTAWRGYRGRLSGTRGPRATRWTCTKYRLRPRAHHLTYHKVFFIRRILYCIAFDCRMFLDISKVTLCQTRPEILNRIHILRMGRQGQHPHALLAFPLDYQFSMMTLLTVIIQTERILE